MKVKAKFKGVDGSLGYRNGKPYQLAFTMRSKFSRNKYTTVLCVYISDSEFTGYCEYNSLKAFLDNWEVL